MKTYYYTLVFLIFSTHSIWAQPSFDLQTISVQPDQTVCLSLEASDFTYLQEIQFSLNWDPTVISFLNVSNLNSQMTDLDISDFDVTFINDGQLGLLWKLGAGCTENNGVTLIDNSTLFDICFTVVGSFGQSTLVEFTNTPFDQFVSRLNANCNDIGEFTRDGLISICPDTCPVIGASSVSFQPNQTVCLDVYAGNFVEITSAQFSMAWDSSILDFKEVRGLNLPAFNEDNFDFSLTENGILSVDWDAPSPLTTNDRIFKICFDQITSFNNTEVQFTDNPIVREINSLNGLGGIFDNGSVHTISPEPDVTFSVSHESGFPDDTVCVKLGSIVTESVTTINFTLQWDENILEYVTIEPHPDLFLGINGLGLDENNVVDGFLTVDYTHPFGASEVVMEEVFNACFKVIGVADEVSEIQLVNQPVEVLMDFFGGNPNALFVPTVSDGSVSVLTPPFNEISGTKNTCPGSIFSYIVHPTDTCITDYNWTITPPIGNIISNSNMDSVEIEWISPGIAQLCVEGIDTCGLNLSVCESIIVTSISPTQEEAELCIGGSTICAGQVFTSPGLFPVTLQSYLGCDSIVNCIITPIISITGDTVQVDLCGPDFHEVCGNFYSTSGIFSTSCTSYQGCDSTAIVDLAILEPLAQIAPPEELTCSNMQVTLDGSGSNLNLVPDGVTTFEWAGPSIIGATDEPTTIVDEPGEYCLKLTHSRNGVSCEDIMCVDVFEDILIGSSNVSVRSTNASGNVGDTVVVEIKADDFENILSFQFEMHWDSSQIKIIDIFDFSIPNLGISNFDVQSSLQGILPVTWLDPNVAGITLNDDTTLFKLAFEILPNINCEALVTFPQPPVANNPVEFTDSDGNIVCVGFTDGVIFAPNNSTIIQSITADTTLCGGGDIQLHVDAPNATSYHWFPEDNLSCFDCPNPTTIVAHSHEFYVSVTDSTGCTDEASVSVNVHFGLDWGLLPFSNSPVCEGDSLELFEELNFDIIEYEWTGPNGFVSTDPHPIILNVDLSLTGNYFATFVSDEGCEGTTDVFVQIQECFQIANIEVIPVSCSGAEDGGILFDIIDGSGDYTISWLGPIPNLPGVVPLTALPEGNYYVTIIDNINGGIKYESFLVGLAPNATIADAGDDVTLPCNGGVVTTLDGSGSSMGPDIEYFWEVISGTPGLSITEKEKMNPVVSGSGCFKLTVTNTATGCIAEDVTCTLVPPPVVFSLESETPYTCDDNPIQIDTFNTNLSNNLLFEWEIIGNGQFLNNSDTTLTPTVVGSAYYNLTITDTLTGCSETQSLFIDELIAAIDNGPIELNCDGILINANNSSMGENLVYEWTGPCILSDPNELEIQIDACLGTYYFTVTDTLLLCSVTDSINVDNIVQNTDLPVAIISNPTILTCVEPTTVLDGFGSSTGVDIVYQWTAPDGNIIGNDISVTVSLSGIYTLEVTNLSNGCQATAQVQVDSQISLPNVEAGPNMVLDCNNPQVILDGSGSLVGPDIEHLWTTIDGNILSGNQTLNPLIDSAGTYVLTVLNTVDGCENQDTVIVTEDFDVIPFAIDDQFLCQGDTLFLDISFLNADTYEWSPSVGIDDPTSPIVSIIPTQNMVYNTTATFANGCQSSVFFNTFFEIDCPWPGDPDTSWQASNADILMIGLAFGELGPPRPDTTINWERKFAFNWTGITPQSGINFKHADTDGNGIVNALDTLAIVQNWGLTHNFTDDEDKLQNSDDRDEEVPFYVEPDTIFPEKKYALPIILGTSDFEAENVYGVSFSINYDPEIVVDGSAKVGFETSWLGEHNSDMISIQKDNHDEGRIDIGITRIDAQNMSGFGQFGTMFITIEDIIFVKGNDDTEDIEETYFEIDNVKIISFEEDTLEVDTNPFPAMVSNNENAFLDSKIDVFPNPTKDNIFIKSKEIRLGKIELFSIDGILLQSTQSIDNQQVLNVSKFKNGIYLLKIQTEKGVLIKRIVLL